MTPLSSATSPPGPSIQTVPVNQNELQTTNRLVQMAIPPAIHSSEQDLSSKNIHVQTNSERALTPLFTMGMKIIQDQALKIKEQESQIVKLRKNLESMQIQASIPMVFGKIAWAKYFGDIGDEPPLPHDIQTILQSPCPYWPKNKVQETHLLVLVPQTVNGKPLTLKTLGEFIQKPLQGTPTKYQTFDLGDYTDAPAAKSHWALLTRDIIEGSRSKSYSNQKALIKAPYEVPTILDATVAILMEHVRTGTRLYSNSPWTYTRCQEKYNENWQLVVGGFGVAGLNVYFSLYGDYVSSGVGGLRKFF